MSINVGLLNLPCLMARKTLSYFGGVPPLGLAYVAAAARAAGYQPLVFDALGEAADRYSLFPCSRGDLLVQGYPAGEIVERIPRNLDVLGIGNLFLHELRFLQELLPMLRAKLPDAVIVLGGENATGMWEDMLRIIPQLTACVLGEGEEPFVRLLQAIERGDGLETVPSLGYRVNGLPHRTPGAARIRDLDAIPWPAWDLFPVENYIAAGLRSGVNRGRSLPILTSRGCPFSCAFCSAPQMWGTTYVSRAPEGLLDEIEHLMDRFRISNFDVHDITAALTKPWIRAFHAAVVQRKLSFTWQVPPGMRSENLDGEMLRLLYESGCRNFGYALESVSPHIITRMRKKVVPERLMNSAREACRLPLRVEVFFVIAYPTETVWDHLGYVRAIVRLAWMGVHSLSVMQFNPYPGSEDYRRFRAEGRIHYEDDSYVYSSLFRTAGQNPGTHSPFSDRYLIVFQFLALLLFWGLQFLFRPWRAFRVLWNLLRAREETTLEQFLVVKTRQWIRVRRKLARMAAPAPGSEIVPVPVADR